MFVPKKPRFTETEVRRAIAVRSHTPRRFASWACVPQAATTGPCGDTWTRSGRSRRITSTPGCPASSARALGRPSETARRGARPRLDILARHPQATAVRRRLEGALLRAVRAGGAVARSDDGPDPRPCQRHRHGQPAREPPHRLPELRSHARHSLRSQLEPRTEMRRVRTELPTAEGRSATVLHDLRRALRPESRGVTRPQDSQAAAIPATPGGNCGYELPGRRPQVRRLRQRDPQMGPAV
jgi:hypothetical protein